MREGLVSQGAGLRWAEIPAKLRTLACALATAWLVLSPAACSSVADEGEDEPLPTAEEEALTEEEALQLEVLCPRNTTFDAEHRLCTNPEVAVGPFPPEMVKACLDAKSAKCEGAYWPTKLALELRGTEFCASGTAFDHTRGVCTDAKYAYGPFTATMIDFCRRHGGGNPCFAMKWRKQLVPTFQQREDDAAARENTDEAATSPTTTTATPPPDTTITADVDPNAPAVSSDGCVKAAAFQGEIDRAPNSSNRCPSPETFDLCVGMINDRPVEMQTAAAFQKMREAARADHVSIRISSGFRTMREQKALYALYKAKLKNPSDPRYKNVHAADPPGCSKHQNGRALDLNRAERTGSSRYPTVYSWLKANAARFGFENTAANEPWHWERTGRSGNR